MRLSRQKNKIYRGEWIQHFWRNNCSIFVRESVKLRIGNPVERSLINALLSILILEKSYVICHGFAAGGTFKINVKNTSNNDGGNVEIHGDFDVDLRNHELKEEIEAAQSV